MSRVLQGQIIVTLLLSLICTCLASFASQDSKDDVATIAFFGKWIASCAPAEIDENSDKVFQKCLKKSILEEGGVSFTDEVAIIRYFGTWLHSCATVSIGVDPEKKFQQCLDINSFLNQ